MTSMLDGVQEFLTPAFLSRVSTQTGESEAAVSKGFMAVMPTLLASIANRSGDTGFMSKLVNLATNSPTDPEVLARAPKPIESTPLESSAGTGWLSGLLSGGSLSSVTNAVARYAGVRASSASSLLTMAGPLVLGYLGRLMRSDNLDGPKLAQRLQAERGSLAAALPAGFSAFLPGAQTADVRTVVDEPVRRVVDEPVRRAEVHDTVIREEKRRSGGWLLPVALGALALAALLWWSGRDRTVVPTETANTARAIGNNAKMMSRTLPGGVQVSVPVGSMEDRLIGYLSAPTGRGAFDFDRIEFETGSTTLTPQSRAQIEGVARVLSAYPQSRILIAGYTDNTGSEDANVALSLGRAEAVMNALRENGAPAASMTAEGFGSQNPIADNATDAGRARNRRVTLSVTG